MGTAVFAVVAHARRGRTADQRPAGREHPRGRVRLVRLHELAAVVREAADAPAIEAAALREHDAVVRRAARAFRAVLPVRFGAMLRDDAAVAEWLETARPALREGLARVTDREQVLVRVYWRSAVPAPVPTPRSLALAGSGRPEGPGARYLAERGRASGWDGLPAALSALRAALEPLVADERLERHATSPLVATVYHLVARGAAARYRRAVARAALAMPEATLVPSGPWPPYAFAPDVLS